VTAISSAAPSSLQTVIPALPESKAQSQSTFKKVFKDLPESDEPDEAQTAGKDRRSGKQADSSVPLPFIAAPAKLLLPLSLPRPEFQAGTPKSSQDPADAEVLDNPKPNTSAPAGEVAFAAKLVDTKLVDTRPVNAGPPQLAASGLPAMDSKSAGPQTSTPKSKEPLSSQPQTDRDTAPAPDQPEAPSTQEQTVVAAAATATRDVIAASAPPQTAEPVSASHAIDQAAPVETVSKAPAAPVNEISVRVAGPDQTSASIHMVDRSGELTVAVRSSDTQLADALRGNVEQLSARLNSGGWNAEVWRPGTVQSASRSEASAQDTARDRQESQPQQFRDPSRRDSQNNQKRPDWVEEFYARNE
jgi:hypothetical protein